MDYGFLGAAQIDKSGNINSSKVGPHHLVGSGGANDCGSPNRVEEIIVVCIHGKDRMLEKVPYITVPGNVVSTVITTEGILMKKEKDNELVLKEIFNFENQSKEKLIEDIKANTGWELKISDSLIERTDVVDEENLHKV